LKQVGLDSWSRMFWIGTVTIMAVYGIQECIVSMVGPVVIVKSRSIFQSILVNVQYNMGINPMMMVKVKGFNGNRKQFFLQSQKTSKGKYRIGYGAVSPINHQVFDFPEVFSLMVLDICSR